MIARCWESIRGRVWLAGLVTALLLGLVGPVVADVFTDDDGGFYEPAIEALAERGILEGTECGDGLFCPDDDTKRWVMAVWMVRALEDAEHDEVGSSRFSDVDAGEWWTPYVERLAELGVTKGCDVEQTRYCPDDPVTRGQMGILSGPRLPSCECITCGLYRYRGARARSRYRCIGSREHHTRVRC